MSYSQSVFSETIASIYDAALQPEAWDEALQRCCRLLNGVAAQVYAIDCASRDCLYQIDHALPERYREEYALHFSRESDRNILHQTRPDIDVSYDYLLHDEREIDRHDCYRFRRDFGFRYYVGGVLSRTPDVLTMAAIQRSPEQGHVSKADIDTFRLLRGHLARAVDVGGRLADLDMRQRGAWQAIEGSHLGVVALGHDGRVRRCNGVARRILEAGDGLVCMAGMLRARRPIDDVKLQAMIGSALLDVPAGTGGTMPVAREDKVRPYSVAVTPVPARETLETLTGDHALVLVNDPDGAPGRFDDILRRHYGLTRRQSDLALLLAGGQSLDASADALGIAEKTARRHLAIIFAKTGLHRQVDLVRLVLSLPQQPDDRPA